MRGVYHKSDEPSRGLAGTQLRHAGHPIERASVGATVAFKTSATTVRIWPWSTRPRLRSSTSVVTAARWGLTSRATFSVTMSDRSVPRLLKGRDDRVLTQQLVRARPAHLELGRDVVRPPLVAQR